MREQNKKKTFGALCTNSTSDEFISQNTSGGPIIAEMRLALELLHFGCRWSQA
jgi:hypothetical protein